MNTITEQIKRFEELNIDVAHFQSADVLSNNQDNYVVLHGRTEPIEVDVIFYKSAHDYVDQNGILLCTRDSYFDALKLAELILKKDE